MASEFAREKAAQCWCHPTTSHLVLEPALAEVFAEMLDACRDDYSHEESDNEIGSVFDRIGI